MFEFLKPKKKRIYLDYASATPLDERVKQAMEPFWSNQFANPSAIHTEGATAKRVVEGARTRLARTLGIRSSGIVFTGSGTESNNLALFGVVDACREAGALYEDIEVITTEIEHASIMEPLLALQAKGVVIKMIPVDSEGRLILKSLPELLSKKTKLVSVAYVNSEIGVVQDIGALSRVVRAFEVEQGVKIVVHTDAAQAPLWLPCQLPSMQVDIMSLDAGKCYGPKGVGVLAFRHGVTLSPYLYGGGQEFGLRSGTENTPGVVGAVEAIVHAQNEHTELAIRVSGLRDYCLTLLLALPDVVLNGSQSHRVANNINISIKGVDAEFAVISLDAWGVAVATKSACSSGSGGGSVVVRTITGDTKRAETTLRITLGKETTKEEIAVFVSKLQQHIEKVRSTTPFLT